MEGDSDRGRHHRGLRDGRELDKEHPVAVLHESLGRDLERQPRLARTPGAGERHEAGMIE